MTKRKQPGKFLVLRANGSDGMSPVGQVARTFETFDAADEQAKSFRDKQPMQTFFVVQAVQVYGHTNKTYSTTLLDQQVGHDPKVVPLLKKKVVT